MGKNKAPQGGASGGGGGAAPASAPSPAVPAAPLKPNPTPSSASASASSSSSSSSSSRFSSSALVLAATIVVAVVAVVAQQWGTPATTTLPSRTSGAGAKPNAKTTTKSTTASRAEDSPESGSPVAAQREAVPDVPTMHALYPANGSPTGVFNRPASEATRVRFTLHGNGDGKGAGVAVDSNDFGSVDDVISRHCCGLENRTSPAEARLCAPRSGARLVNDVGVRVMSFADVEDGQRVYCVLQGVHFVWPLTRVGARTFPKNVVGPIQGKPIVLTQMTENPRVFTVDNFVAPEEIRELLENNKNRMTPSEVGFYGWQDDTRTSSTSWDFNSPAALAIQERTFRLLGMDVEPELADAMQVLRYTADGYKGKGEWYKPHVDWFSAEGFDGSDPKVDNGTNRFATMFLYLSTVEEGGHTVFPLSTTHAGYDGKQIVHDGTVDTPGYINTGEARAACNETATKALRVPPVAGNAVLFYSQGPDGTLDPWSLHGGCPPTKGIKWSANVWVWNRKRPDKSQAKDKPKGAPDHKSPSAMSVSFRNARTDAVVVYWDANTPTDPSAEDYDAAFARDVKNQRFVVQFELKPGMQRDINTFDKHVFVAQVKGTKKAVWAAAMRRDQSKPQSPDEPEVVSIA